MNNPITHAPIPIIVGITGHRDLLPQDIPSLTKAFTDFIHQLQSSYPHTPVKVMSSLASGADLLAGKIDLSMQIPVIAPLPLPVEEYLNDLRPNRRKQNF